jgi:hypothetical protein
LENVRDLLDLPLVSLAQDRRDSFSIRTAISQPIRFCFSAARLLQAGGE